MSDLTGLGLEFDESMSGWIGIDETDPVEGRTIGEQKHTTFQLKSTIRIPDLALFLNISDHTAELTGTVTFKPFGDAPIPIENGVFNLFCIDRWTGIRQMVYSFTFKAEGQTYCVYGEKRIKDDPGFDMMRDMTTLFTTIHKGRNRVGEIYGAGQIFFHLLDAPSLMASMTVIGDAGFYRTLAAKLAFLSFAFGCLRNEYLSCINPLYDTEYQNLVLQGKAASGGGPTEFFLISGAHEKGFPWGDDESFSDVLLAIGNSDSGYERYCMSVRPTDAIRINVGRGTYRYKGPVFKLTQGYKAHFSEMQNGHQGYVKCEAEFEINFDAKPYANSPMPFQMGFELADRISYRLGVTLRSILPSEKLLGVFITPHTVTVKDARLTITEADKTLDLRVDPATAFGEAEVSTIRNIKEPTLLYGYICALRPHDKIARVQIHSNSLRDERRFWSKDLLDALIGAGMNRVASKDLLMKDGKLVVTDLARAGERIPGAPRFVKVGDPVIEVNNDHFPTACLQRRIVQVRDPDGVACLALEEDMDMMRLEPQGTDREVTVAAIRRDTAKDALDEVIRVTDFFGVLDRKRGDKPASEFAIVIKPNFMFAYSKKDRTTFTDPALVGHLADRLRKEGYADIAVVEARSTYGEYFTNRDVPYVANYVGYDCSGRSGYRVVDLTEETLTPGKYVDENVGPTLGHHRVPKTWADADFRISFAKNKTHTYAYYTLTLKNVYGALPLENKFKEYHCDRDIYHTTIEYLTKYPVHFGLIDAFESADGPLGIFADPAPNKTETILGGSDLVAVDWVGASKMGIDPMISQYMDLAVKAFGKPKINLVGDRNPYKPWLNVPCVLSLFAHYGLDTSYYFGNIIYMVGAYIDEDEFKHKSRDKFVKAARAMAKPLQKAIFLHPGDEQSGANKALAKFLTWLGSV